MKKKCKITAIIAAASLALGGALISELPPLFWTVFMLPYLSIGLQLESDILRHLNPFHN